MTMKTQQSEEAKTEYANQLQKTNDMQTLHYHTAMPEVFQHLQVLLCHNGHNKTIVFTFYYVRDSYVMLFIRKDILPFVVVQGFKELFNLIKKDFKCRYTSFEYAYITYINQSQGVLLTFN